ncbi:minor capsid protein [Escherichia coli]|uniref:phage tail terminator protein n=1 Tax=Escherichia coli TaxID=562 RepID=UPI00398887CD
MKMALAGLLVTPNTGIAINHKLAGFYHNLSTVIVRNATITKAVAKAHNITGILPVEETVSDGVYFRLAAFTLVPITYPKNEGSLIEAGIPVRFPAHDSMIFRNGLVAFFCWRHEGADLTEKGVFQQCPIPPPGQSDAGGCKVSFGGVDLGYTKGGVQVGVESETLKVTVDQLGQTIAPVLVQGRNITITAPLAESVLQNMVDLISDSCSSEEDNFLAVSSG